MNEIIKILLTVGVQALLSLIPALSGLLGGPLGFLVGWAISFLTGKLADWLERLGRYTKISAEIQVKVNAVLATAAALKVAQDPGATKEAHEKAISNAVAAARDLSKFRLY